MHAKFLSTKCIDFHPVCMCRCFFLGRKGCIELPISNPLSKLGKLLRKFFCRTTFLLDAGVGRSLSKRPPSLWKNFERLMICSCKRKSIENVVTWSTFNWLSFSVWRRGEKVFHLNERGLVSISKLFYAHKPLLLKASFCLIVSKTIGGIKVYMSPYYNRIHFPHMVTPSVTMCDMQQKLALSNPITFSHIALSHDFNSTSTPFVMINFIFCLWPFSHMKEAIYHFWCWRHKEGSPY